MIVHHASTSDTNKAMKKFPVKKFPVRGLFLSSVNIKRFEEVAKNFGLHGCNYERRLHPLCQSSLGKTNPI